MSLNFLLLTPFMVHYNTQLHMKENSNASTIIKYYSQENVLSLFLHFLFAMIMQD